MVNDTHNIEIRKATANDIPLVAWAVFEAMDMDTDDLTAALAASADPQSMYSWTNAYVATVDGQPAGCLVAYDGARYLEIRRYTWPRLWTSFDAATIDTTDIETVPGELYLDTLAVKPQYRGLELGRRLIMFAIDDLKDAGTPTLIVSAEKPRLARYYASMGFAPADRINFLGSEFIRMRRV